MLTRREAQQRAAVYDCSILIYNSPRGQEFAAQHDSWSRKDFMARAKFRDDIMDAVLDCKGIQDEYVRSRNSNNNKRVALGKQPPSN